VPEYQQTAAIWGRGVLQHEFGVHAREIEWFMERTPDKSHGGSTAFTPPAGVTVNQIPATTNIGEMLVRDELDATLLYLTNPNLVDRSRIDFSKDARVRPLFSDRAAESRRYYSKTGIHQINHTVVVRRSLLERHPWVALNLYSAFAAARAEVVNRAKVGLRSFDELGMVDDVTRKAMANDPMAYGVKASRKVLETVTQYVHEQGLTKRRVALEELFAPSTMDL